MIVIILLWIRWYDINERLDVGFDEAQNMCDWAFVDGSGCISDRTFFTDFDGDLVEQLLISVFGEGIDVDSFNIYLAEYINMHSLYPKKLLKKPKLIYIFIYLYIASINSFSGIFKVHSPKFDHDSLFSDDLFYALVP